MLAPKPTRSSNEKLKRQLVLNDLHLGENENNSGSLFEMT